MGKNVAVIGAGVIGLTSAIAMQDAGYQVTIYTREPTLKTTSRAAGAMWSGFTSRKMKDWAEVSLKVFQQLISVKDSGVVSLLLKDVSRERREAPWFAAQLPHFERIPSEQLEAPYVDAFVMEIPFIEPPRYLPYLLNRFASNGGKLIVKRIHAFDELSSNFDIIVNCSGVGARELANDDSVHPIRGQTVILDAPDIEQGFMDDEAFIYFFPRKDGVLLGGNKQIDVTTLEASPEQRQDILQRCGSVEGRLLDRTIIDETVGLRPGRDTVRLEAETISNECLVIHNYGHAGIGYTLSWGCAYDVVALAKDSA